MKTISEKIKKIVSEHLGVDYKMISEESNFAKDLGADSLDTVELIMAFEEAFKCEIPDNTAEKIFIVNDAIKLIEGIKNKKIDSE